MRTDPKTTSIEVSVVVPVFGSASSLRDLFHRLSQELRRMSVSYEIVFVDDCGPVESLQILRELSSQHREIVVIEMLRNVGQVMATAHGIAYTCGKYVVTIDDDLQQWPEDISQLYEEIVSKNLDLVVGRFPEKKHSMTRNLASECARKLAVRSLKVNKDTHFSSFRIMRREVFENYFGDGSLHLATPGWMYVTAPCHSEVKVRHSERTLGTSSYSFKTLIGAVRPLFKAAIDGSLQILIVVSLFQIFAAIGGGIYLGIQYSRGKIDSPGFTSVVFLLLAIIGILGVGLGFLSQYLRSLKQLILSKPDSLVRVVHKSER